MINAKLIIGLIVLGILLYLFTPLGALVSESSAFTQCTKVSDTEAVCNFYNRGINPSYFGGPVTMPRFNEWAGKNGITYNKCKVTSVSVGTVSGCSCGPGSGSYGCSCCMPQATSLNTVYDATGDDCTITFDHGWEVGSAKCSDNGGNSVSYSGTVVFFSEAPKCGQNVVCGGWSACTSWHEKQRTCTDECNIQTTEKAYCDPIIEPKTCEDYGYYSVGSPPEYEPITVDNLACWKKASPLPECVEGKIEYTTCPDGSQVVDRQCINGKWRYINEVCPTPVNLLDYIISVIRGWLSMIGINF